MDVFKTLLLAASESIQVQFFANLVISLLGAIWILSSRKQSSDIFRWQTWSVFWVATSGYYFLELSLGPDSVWWIPYLSLDLSIAALFIGALKELDKLDENSLHAVIVVIVTARLLDIIIVAIDPHAYAYCHQALASLSFLFWSWIHRVEHPSSSLVLLTYGLIQLPLQQFAELANIELTVTGGAFVDLTFLAYFLSKFPLLPATLTSLTYKDRS